MQIGKDLVVCTIAVRVLNVLTRTVIVYYVWRVK